LLIFPAFLLHVLLNQLLMSHPAIADMKATAPSLSAPAPAPSPHADQQSGLQTDDTPDAKPVAAAQGAAGERKSIALQGGVGERAGWTRVLHFRNYARPTDGPFCDVAFQTDGGEQDFSAEVGPQGGKSCQAWTQWCQIESGSFVWVAIKELRRHAFGTQMVIKAVSAEVSAEEPCAPPLGAARSSVAGPDARPPVTSAEPPLASAARPSIIPTPGGPGWVSSIGDCSHVPHYAQADDKTNRVDLESVTNVANMALSGVARPVSAPLPPAGATARPVVESGDSARVFLVLALPALSGAVGPDLKQDTSKASADAKAPSSACSQAPPSAPAPAAASAELKKPAAASAELKEPAALSADLKGPPPRSAGAAPAQDSWNLKQRVAAALWLQAREGEDRLESAALWWDSEDDDDGAEWAAYQARTRDDYGPVAYTLDGLTAQESAEVSSWVAAQRPTAISSLACWRQAHAGQRTVRVAAPTNPTCPNSSA
jgi:hypothetical protein